MTKEAIKTNLNEILDFIKFAGSMIPTEHWSWDNEKYDWIESLNEAIGMLDQEPCEDATLKDIFCMGCEYKEQESKIEWIPISERLPEDGDEVLTCSNGGFIEIQSLEDGGYWGNQHGDWTDFDEVIAWMPLPEPYKIESEVIKNENDK